MKYNKLEVQDTKVIGFMTEDKFRLLRHIVLLLGILVILFCSKNVTEYHGEFRQLKIAIIYLSLVFMCYMNMNVLVPSFFFRGKYVAYLVLLMLLVVVSLQTLAYTLEYLFPNGTGIHGENLPLVTGFYKSFIILLPIILTTTLIKLFQRWVHDIQRINELNKITFNMELNELRNQINPHFLFNMLNGIKSQTRTSPEKASMIIMKLSEFLRYQLYENNEDYTLLKSEISFLKNFLDLEKIRRDNLTVEITDNLESLRTKGILLPPNLFTTFVENAIKHSVNIDSMESYVRISVEVGTDNIHFKCINSVDPEYEPTTTDKKNSGLGISNIKRRLELLYGEKHSLVMESTVTEYIVNLTIPL